MHTYIKKHPDHMIQTKVPPRFLRWRSEVPPSFYHPGQKFPHTVVSPDKDFPGYSFPLLLSSVFIMYCLMSFAPRLSNF